MVGMICETPQLSVIVLCLNEAERLPLLLADLRRSSITTQILLADGGSEDASPQIAALAGAGIVRVHPAGRGPQLRATASEARGDWLLFLHADSRLPAEWSTAIVPLLRSSRAAQSAWYFDLRIDPSTVARRLLERGVALRSRLLQRPYGDQGLLLHRRLYERCGGYANLPLMEDLDLVERLSRISRLRRIGVSLTTDGRRWQTDGVLIRSLRNAQLRRRWRRGEPAEQLAARYHGTQLAYQKPQR